MRTHHDVKMRYGIECPHPEGHALLQDDLAVEHADRL